MSEWYDSQKKLSSNFRKLLQERIEKVNPRRELTAEENKRLNKSPGTMRVYTKSFQNTLRDIKYLKVIT